MNPPLCIPQRSRGSYPLSVWAGLARAHLDHPPSATSHHLSAASAIRSSVTLGPRAVQHTRSVYIDWGLARGLCQRISRAFLCAWSFGSAV